MQDVSFSVWAYFAEGAGETGLQLRRVLSSFAIR